jgi:hypothetical protein
MSIDNQCEHSGSITQAIKGCDNACNDLRRALEKTDKVRNPDEAQVLTDALVIHQQAVTDMIKMRQKHQASCTECSPR